MSKFGELAARTDVLTHSRASTASTRRAAVRYVCGHAKNAADARHLLDVLGLDPKEGK